MDLNSDWKFIRQDLRAAEAVAFDDSQWQAVQLPHTWNNIDGQDGGDDYYRGVGWYRRHLKIDPQEAGKSFFLRFGAASTVADLFVNGQRAGSHHGAFATFCFDVTPLLHVGEDNVIAVKVNNAPNENIAPLSGDFTVFGGLYREAHLLVLDKLSVTPLDDAASGVYITQTNVSATSAELEIRTRLRNDYDTPKIPVVRCRITDANGKIVRLLAAKQKVPARSSADVIQHILILRPHLWNGRIDPYLYHVTIEVSDGRRIADTVNEPLGLRYFRVDPDKGFFLNGRHYPLYGVNRHQDRLNKGWAIGPAEHDEDFRLIKELGCTAVRLAHYQHAQYFYDLCDRGGMIVWAELPLVNAIGPSAAFANNARAQLTELVKQNFNHPSIIFWSLFNELHSRASWNDAPAHWDLVPELNKLVKQLDPTRLTTAAAVIRPDDRLNQVTDVMAFNRYSGWYFGAPTYWPTTLDELRQKLPGRAIGISEYGAGASVEQHESNPHQPKPDSSWHPEEWQCTVHEAAWKAMKQRPWLWCTFIWNMFDFAVDSRNEGDHPGRNDKGLVTYDRKTKKDAFYWYKANWTTAPFVHITSQRYTNRTAATTPVKVYSNCESVELRVNGVSKGSLRSDDHIFLWNSVTLREGDNRIEAIGQSANRQYHDSCGWTYTPPLVQEGKVVRFPHPERIRYDGQCLTIDGKDILIYSGSFHYFRCPQPLWRDRFRKIKEAGFNAVETYVPWNWYERDQPAGPDDFSKFDFSDLKAWLEMAHEEFGLYTIIRPGPYICAEWDGGGFPRWLLTLKPAQAKRHVWLRSDDPGYLAWSKHWFDAVCPVVAAEQVTRKPKGHGGVILFQIENEYDLYKGVPERARFNYLRALYDCAVADGIEVPIFTCWTKQCRRSNDERLHNVFDGSNMYPRWNMKAVEERLHALRLAQPDAPVIVPELQGGWFAQVGHQLSEDQEGIDATQINHLTLLNLQEGTTILNYYMLFGGSNFGDWASRDQLSTYDYFAPIREPGGVGDKYLAVKAIGLMLLKHGASLARSRIIPCEVEASQKDVNFAIRRGSARDTFVFCRNRSRTKALHGSATVKSDEGDVLRFDYDLAPGGFKILYLPAGVTNATAGEWLPKPAAPPERLMDIPASVRIKTALKRFDQDGRDWVSVKNEESLPALGVNDSRFVLYRTEFQLTPEQLQKFRYLALDLSAPDKVVLAVNGKIMVPSELSVDVGRALHVGANELLALYENRGQSNFGPSMADLPGIRAAALILHTDGSTPLKNWHAKLVSGQFDGMELKLELARKLAGVAENWWSSDVARAGWSRVDLDTTETVARKGKEAPLGTPEALATWYRMEFELPKPQANVWVPWRLLLDCSGGGFIYLNGHALGRYWDVGPQREYYLPECWLNFGDGKTNIVALCLRPTEKGALLRAAEVSPYAEYAERRQPPVVLTPKPPATPRINGPKVFGVRPGSPFLFTISATGERPMEFSVDELPSSLRLDPTTGQITGVLSEKGEHVVTLQAKNSRGVAERKLRIVVGDRIALTPPMGWNSWNCWAGSVDQDKVLRSARAMVASGLAQHGWTYINIDDTWQGERGGPFNAIQPNEKFPDIKALCDEIHQLGLKVGIYSTPWTTSYAGHCGGSAENVEGFWGGPPKGKIDYSGKVLPLAVGRYSFATNDEQQWAAWGFDYLKYDWYPNSVPQTREMAKALRASGRDIVFSLSNSAPFNHAKDWARSANSWRTTGDIRDLWPNMSGIGFSQDKWAPFAGPGHWNDPDMLVVGDVGWGPQLHPSRLTPDEQYTHISLWCLLSAPLLLGCDLEHLDKFTLGLLTNDEVLDVDQDPLGKQAVAVASDSNFAVFSKPLEDGSKAVGLFNRDLVTTKITARWTDLGLTSRQTVRDLWRQKDIGVFDEKFEATVPSHGVVFVKLTPSQ
ncbi:MAG TPA: beta-galactosidase [Verrucomicrobiae bacterium]|nr:beta-galactosidase [Verrucomicrobiae bacterium]